MFVTYIVYDDCEWYMIKSCHSLFSLFINVSDLEVCVTFLKQSLYRTYLIVM